MKTPPLYLLAAVSLSLALMLCFSGCTNIPPEVRQMADNVRTNVAGLHGVHAEDVRALALVVNEREAALKEADCEVRHFFQDEMEALIDASKSKVLAQFDQRAGDVLGANFQVSLEHDVFPKFDELERTNFNLLLDQIRSEATHANDPSAPGKARATELKLLQARSQRENAAAQYFIALATALKRERFNFETEMDQKLGDVKIKVISVVSATNAADPALSNYNKRVDDDLALLDQSYNQLDQSLSDISTDLDSGAVSKRFAKSFFTGVGGALVGDLKNGQFGASALTQFLKIQAPGLVNQLKTVETNMLSQVGTSVTNAVNSVPAPAPLTN